MDGFLNTWHSIKPKLGRKNSLGGIMSLFLFFLLLFPKFLEFSLCKMSTCYQRNMHAEAVI